jgi:hypothetical protein
MRASTRRSSAEGGGRASAPAWAPAIRTRQVEQRPRPPHTDACGIPRARLASSTLVPRGTATTRPPG